MKLSRHAFVAALALSLGSIAPLRADDPPKPAAPAEDVSQERPEDAADHKGPKGEKPKDPQAAAAARLKEAQAKVAGENLRAQAGRVAMGEEVSWADVPEAAKKALQGILGDAKVEKVLKAKMARTVVFEAREEGGQLRGGRVSEDGTVLESGSKAGELPAGVNTFVAEQLKGQAGDVRKVTLTYYEIDTGKQGRRSTVRISGAGTPLSLGGGMGMATRMGGPNAPADMQPPAKKDPNFIDRPGPGGQKQKEAAPADLGEKPAMKRADPKPKSAPKQ